MSTEQVDPPQIAKYEAEPVEISEGEFWMWRGRENEGWKVEALKLASEVSGNNLDFIRKITAENGNLGHTDQSKVWLRKGANGKNQVCRGDLTGCWREQSYGYCQIHRPSHPDVYSNPDFYQNKIFTDKRYQMELCYQKFIGGVAMYAPSRPASEFYLTDKL